MRSDDGPSSFWPWLLGVLALGLAIEALALMSMQRAAEPAPEPAVAAVAAPPAPVATPSPPTVADEGARAEREMERWIDELRGEIARALGDEQPDRAATALARFRERLADHPASARGDEAAARLEQAIARRRRELGVVPWTAPPVRGTNKVGSWQLQPGSLIGRCPPGREVAIVQLGDPAWRDYEVRFEIQLAQGDVGFYLRGMAPTAQFPGFLTRAGYKAGHGDWFAVRAAARGGEVSLELRCLGDERPAQVQRRRNDRFANGIFGFVLHPSGEVNIRQLEARPLAR